MSFRHMQAFKALPLGFKIAASLPVGAVCGASVGVASAAYHTGRYQCPNDKLVEWRAIGGFFFGLSYPISIPLYALTHFARNAGQSVRSSSAQDCTSSY